MFKNNLKNKIHCFINEKILHYSDIILFIIYKNFKGLIINLIINLLNINNIFLFIYF